MKVYDGDGTFTFSCICIGLDWIGWLKRGVIYFTLNILFLIDQQQQFLLLNQKLAPTLCDVSTVCIVEGIIYQHPSTRKPVLLPLTP